MPYSAKHPMSFPFKAPAAFFSTLALAAMALLAPLQTSCAEEAAGQAAAQLQEQRVRNLTPDDPSGFVAVADVIPDLIEEIRYYSDYNFVGERIDGYEQPRALLTREAAEALRAAADDLRPLGFRLKIYDAYRPQEAVDHFVRWAKNPDDQRMKRDFYPETDKGKLFSRGYIASRSGHSRGSTVDLTIVDAATGTDADMGGSFDWFGTRSHADYTEGLTKEQIKNRAVLRDAMLRHGFKGIRTEWWHYTLKNEPYPKTYFTFPVKSLR
ncbi:MAG: M15 family metallopeptidase [Mailhella sp.]|nr:M15 family metallopeptidase [Mailhella sp.]